MKTQSITLNVYTDTLVILILNVHFAYAVSYKDKIKLMSKKQIIINK